MGTLSFFLTKYNHLRNPQVFLTPYHHGETKSIHLGVRLRGVFNFGLDAVFKEDRRLNYNLGNRYLRTKYLKAVTFLFSSLFLGNFDKSTARTNLFQGSFKKLKKHLKPLVNIRDFSKLPTYTARFTRFKHFPRFIFVYLTLNRYFLTKTARFCLSLRSGYSVTPTTQFHLYSAKLLTQDYTGLRWGVYFYPQSSLFGYYRAVAANGIKSHRMSRFYADGLLDFLNEEDFPELLPTTTLSTTQAVESQVERNSGVETISSLPTFYLRNEAFSKGRYARNRQTYRTGVLWCV